MSNNHEDFEAAAHAVAAMPDAPEWIEDQGFWFLAGPNIPNVDVHAIRNFVFGEEATDVDGVVTDSTDSSTDVSVDDGETVQVPREEEKDAPGSQRRTLADAARARQQSRPTRTKPRLPMSQAANTVWTQIEYPTSKPDLEMLLNALGDGGNMRTENEKLLRSFKMFWPSIEEIQACRHPRDKGATMKFYTRLNELVEYKSEKGHTNVPQKYGKLGIWVNKVRQEKKNKDSCNNLLNDLRVAKLNQIGFNWGEQKGIINWNTRYEELVAFKEREGHCNVKTRDKDSTYKTLGRWVSTQRREYKKFLKSERSQLDEQKIALLNKIGFRWNMVHATK